MRRNLDHMECWRITHPLLGRGDSHNGCFVIDRRGSRPEFRKLDTDSVDDISLPYAVPIGLQILCSNGSGWDHVSVSRRDRCPTWEEMCWAKDQFFHPEETVMQLHVPAADHINCHNFCLHLWRPHNRIIPMPPASMVGPKQ